MEADGEQSDAAPRVEPPMNERQVRRVSPHEYRRERRTDASGRCGDGARSKNPPGATIRQRSSLSRCRIIAVYPVA